MISDNIEIAGVDGDGEGMENPTPQQQEIEMDNTDLEIHEDPPHIEVETVQEDTAEVETAQEEAAEFAPAQPMQNIPEVRRSARVRTQTKPGYIPSMTGSRYGYAVTQLEDYGVLHPDSHMFTQGDFYQSDPDVVAMVMTQLSLNWTEGMGPKSPYSCS